jgi:hypothetical protein
LIEGIFNGGKALILKKEKAPLEILRRFGSVNRYLLNHGDGAGLFAFFAIGDFKFNFVTFVERAVALALNFRIVNEKVGAIFVRDETIALFTVEPLDCALSTFCHCLSPVSESLVIALANGTRAV